MVDDDPLVRRAIRALLHGVLGYELDEAETGTAARELLSREQYSAVIVDVSLPDCSGLEILRNVRETSRMLPVLVLTGHTEEAYAKRALEDGATAFLDKARAAKYLLTTLPELLAATAPNHEQL